MIVVDTNIITYLWIPGHEMYQSRELLVYDHDWWVPPLYRSEMRSVLVLHVRKGIIRLKDSIRLLEKIEMQFQNSTMDVPSSLVLTLGDSTTCSSYDCEYVGLAMLLECPLITQDKKLLNSFPKIAITPVTYLGRKHG
jgi:predicted nucleic acid-binding protein